MTDPNTHAATTSAEVFADLTIAAARVAAALCEELRRADLAMLKRLDRAITEGAELAVRCDLGSGSASLLVVMGNAERVLVTRRPGPAPVAN